MDRIIRNSIRCRECGDVIESKRVRDYVLYSCRSCGVDAGHEYFIRMYAEGD